MGNWTYCKKCRIPVKEFDYDNSMICGHNDTYRSGLYFQGTDHEEFLEPWNKYFPDRQVTYDMAMARIPSPYMVNEFGVLLDEAEEELLNIPYNIAIQLNPWKRNTNEKI